MANIRKVAFVGQDGFGGGLSSENPIVLSKNQMILANNVLIGTTASRRKRPGIVKWHLGSYDETASWPSDSVPVRGLIDFWRTEGLAGIPEQDLFLHSDDKVWSIDDRLSEAVNRTGALSLSDDTIPCYQVFNQKVYFVSSEEGDGYNYWDGVTATAVASASAPSDGVGHYLTAHLGRMIMAGFDNAPFTVWFSSSFNPEDWSTVGPSDALSFDLDDDGDPQGITGISSFQSRLYVFTRRSVYEITGTTAADLVVTRISKGIGCVAHNSICQIPNDVVFASDRGVHSLRQVSSGRQSEVSFVSLDIQRLWTEMLNASLLNRISAVYNENTNNVVFSIVSSGTQNNDDILAYNIERGTWTIWNNTFARCLAFYLNNNKPAIIMGGLNGKIGLFDINEKKDWGANFPYRWKTGILYPGDTTVERRFHSITLYASSDGDSSILISWSIDGRRSGSKAVQLISGTDLLGVDFILGESTLSTGQFLPVTVGIDEVGYGIQIDVSSSDSRDIETYGFVLEVSDANQNYT